jgi:pimeloyl-ACP methyl ester carboxylesterase
MIKIKKIYLFVSALVLAVSCIPFIGATPVQAASVNGTCQQVHIPVGLGPNQANNLQISGTLCTPNHATDNTAIDVLIPGGTYASVYWDFPYQAPSYSYVEKTLAAGRATLNIDRLGTGASSKPLSALVTEDADAYTMHQAIQWARGAKHYSNVTVIGHSAGSIAAAHEAAQYNDVTKLVLTGFLHSPSIHLILDVGAGDLYPAALDNQFFGKIIDPGYLTTTPGRRGPAFYNATADPNVIAYDEAHKDIVATTDAAQMITEILLPAPLNIAQKIKAPVLTIAGDHDVLCGPALIGVDCSSSASIQSYESPFYPQAKSFTAISIPNTGHNLPLHPSKDQSFAQINQWIETH